MQSDPAPKYKIRVLTRKSLRGANEEHAVNGKEEARHAAGKLAADVGLPHGVVGHFAREEVDAKAVHRHKEPGSKGDGVGHVGDETVGKVPAADWDQISVEQVGEVGDVEAEIFIVVAAKGKRGWCRSECVGLMVRD